jgi:hypothetical protein
MRRTLINTPNKEGDLWVKEGKLWIGRQQPEARFSSADYCLLRLDFLRERPVPGLAFTQLWKQIKELVWREEPEKAKALSLELGRQLAISPDLTTTLCHRVSSTNRFFGSNCGRPTWIAGSDQAVKPLALIGNHPT